MSHKTSTDKSQQAQPPAYAPPPADEFAQTRPPDDLFDDDFVPIHDAPVQQHEPPPAEPTAEEAAHAFARLWVAEDHWRAVDMVASRGW